LEDSIVDRIEVLSSGIEKHYLKEARILDAGVAFGALTLDVITDYCFDQSFECLSKPDFSPEWKKTFTDMFEAIPLLRNWSFIAGNMTKLPESWLHRMNPTIEKFVVMKNANREKITHISKIWEQDQLTKSKEATKVVDDDDADADADAVTHTGGERTKRTIFYDILDSQVLPKGEPGPITAPST
jgi:hypothetical protein